MSHDVNKQRNLFVFTLANTVLLLQLSRIGLHLLGFLAVHDTSRICLNHSFQLLLFVIRQISLTSSRYIHRWQPTTQNGF